MTDDMDDEINRFYSEETPEQRKQRQQEWFKLARDYQSRWLMLKLWFALKYWGFRYWRAKRHYRAAEKWAGFTIIPDDVKSYERYYSTAICSRVEFLAGKR